jgi:hypothetical protein
MFFIGPNRSGVIEALASHALERSCAGAQSNNGDAIIYCAHPRQVAFWDLQPADITFFVRIDIFSWTQSEHKTNLNPQTVQ